jgi:hypothetical protein
MPPVNDVLSMEMLLCFILQYLEPDDILRCRGVCSYFNQVIQTSTMVKRACYYSSTSSSISLPGLTSSVESTLDIGGYTMNPLLRKRFPQFFSIAKDNMGLWRRWTNPRSPKGRLAREAAVQVGASWRGMLVSQPALTRLDVLWITPSRPRRTTYGYKHDILHYPCGLTMGVLYSLVVNHLKWPGTDFALDWSAALAKSEEPYDISILARPDLYFPGPGRRPWPLPPPMYPPLAGHPELTALSAARVTLLLYKPPRGSSSQKPADRAWFDKWSLRSASQPSNEEVA